MTEQEYKKVIETLKEDKHYYGDFGKQYLSNSSIKTLLNNPLEYGQPVKKTKEMLIGTYIHNDLQGVKNNLPVIEIGSRNANVYKEAIKASGEEMILLAKEVAEIEPILAKVKRNRLFMELLNDNLKPNEIEQPEVGYLFGTWFKAKADRVNASCNVVIDIKTTSDISKFKSSFFQYGYDTQAYIYNKLFDREVIFLVIDKKTGALAHVSVSDHILIQAEEKVKRAVQIKDLYFGEQATGDLDQHINIYEI